jgi:hypothetical protein
LSRSTIFAELRYRHQRQNADRACRREPTAHGLNDGLQRIQRTRAEVAEDDAECSQPDPLCRGPVVVADGIESLVVMDLA